MRRLTFEEILRWVREEDPAILELLWVEADAVRRKTVGDAVHLRGLIEISNSCVRQCKYCGIRAGNTTVERYRMDADEIMQCVHQAVQFEYGTVVLQAGEDPGIETQWMSNLIRQIRDETDLAVTLSLGERDEADYRAWREAGADRYLLRFETSNRALFDWIHPPLPGRVSDRPAILRQLRDLGYEVGSGIMIGIPGQNHEDLARDIQLFRDLDLDMIGVGPYIPHPQTPLGNQPADPTPDQVANTELMTYKTVALTRLVCPWANIPSTTALATINQAQGRELGLMRGANVVMPNLTPVKYRALYEIYPAKACLNETGEECQGCVKERIASIGRIPGKGRGEAQRSVSRSKF